MHNRDILLRNPALIPHNVDNGINQANHESAYFAAVKHAGRTEYLLRADFPVVARGAYTTKQLPLGLARLGSWLAVGFKPDASLLPAADGPDPNFVPPAWRY